MDELIDLVQSEQDETKRKAIFAEVQKMFIDEGPVIVAYHLPSVTAMRKNVQGFQPHPSAWLDVRGTWLA
jgi:peptide/nickel transport system substrate-binding protein